MIHFKKEIEGAYQAELSEFFHHRIRTGSVWGILFHPLFALLDHVVYPQFFLLFLTLRISSVGFIIIGLAASFFKWSRRFPQQIAMFQYITLCASILVMIHTSEGYKSPYYVGLILTLLVLLFIYPLSFKNTLVVTMFVFLGYLVPILVVGGITEPKIFVTNISFFSGVIFFINVSAEIAGSMRRQEFIGRYNLAQANEELKVLDRMKTQFFANVSHEVRTPLTSIIAPLQSLRQGDAGDFSLDQSMLLEQMHRNAIRLLDLINQMLDFSKLEAGKVQLRLSSVNLAEYTSDVVGLFKEVTVRKGLNLEFESSPAAGEPIYVDLDRYERILMNLIRNAVKFTETGGLTVRLDRAGDSLELTVTDTGIGIPEQHLEQIFKRFEQVDNTTTRPYEGTGLGLAIVEESIRLMHGTIKVESVVDVGTVFTVTVPTNLTDREPTAFVERRQSDRRGDAESWAGDERRAEERRKADYSKIPVSELIAVESLSFDSEETAEDAESTEHSGHCVLLAEDNDDLRRYITRILRKFGHKVIPVANGAEALEFLGKGDIDLLVSDIMMPKMDGYELLRSIRSDDDKRDLPVIMITAKAGEDPKLKALGIGADDYLPKPINIRELDARIRNLISSRNLRRAAADAAVLDQRIDELRMSFSQALSIRDAETGTHSKEVLDLGSLIARELGIEIDQTLKDSLLLHDIGKIGIPDHILLKPNSLDEHEMAVMEKHAEIGMQLLESFSNFKEVSQIILAHQEHWDGTGYPNGLKGEEIPKIARIIAVADAYHAMTNTRPYRQALTHEEAVKELKEYSGTQFDPQVVEAFLKGLGID